MMKADWTRMWTNCSCGQLTDWARAWIMRGHGLFKDMDKSSDDARTLPVTGPTAARTFTGRCPVAARNIPRCLPPTVRILLERCPAVARQLPGCFGGRCADISTAIRRYEGGRFSRYCAVVARIFRRQPGGHCPDTARTLPGCCPDAARRFHRQLRGHCAVCCLNFR